MSLLEPRTEVLPARERVLDRGSARASPESIVSSGPGSFGGPFVDSVQALAMLAAFIAGFTALSALQLRRRDVA